MIPILYKSKETDFTTNGLGALADTISCLVTEIRNDQFECEFSYPVFGPLYQYIEEDCIVKAKPNDTSDPQLFRIYKSSKPIKGIVTFFAEHISYILTGNPIKSVAVESCDAQGAMNVILNAGIFDWGFTGQSDITSLNSASYSLVSVRSALGGTEGSILDTWGGEFEFDNFIVKLHKARGKNTGVRIAYGKNLTDINQEKNIAETYTGVLPYAKYTPESSTPITVTLDESVIYSAYANNYGHQKILIKDFSEGFSDGETITQDLLRTKAQSWVNTSGFDTPSINITVSFKCLGQSPEYKKFAELEHIGLCDTLTVYFDKLGISVSAKVIKTIYNTLTDQYQSIELGDAKPSLADTVAGTQKEIVKQSSLTGVKLMGVADQVTAYKNDANTQLSVLASSLTSAFQSADNALDNKIQTVSSGLIAANTNITNIANAVSAIKYTGAISGDFNNYKTSGIYSYSGSGVLNAPTAVLGLLEVLTDGNNVIQRYTITSAACSVYIRVYIKSSSVWSAWIQK